MSKAEKSEESSASDSAGSKKSAGRIIWRVRVARSYGGLAPFAPIATHYFSTREKAHLALFSAVEADTELHWQRVERDHEVRIQFILFGWRYDAWLDNVEHTLLIDAVSGETLLQDNINAYCEGLHVEKLVSHLLPTERSLL